MKNVTAPRLAKGGLQSSDSDVQNLDAGHKVENSNQKWQKVSIQKQWVSPRIAGINKKLVKQITND